MRPADEIFEKAMALPWISGEGKNGMGVNAPDEGPDAGKLALLMEAGEEGSVDAAKQLLDIFLYGKHNFKADFAQARHWAEKLIDSGNANAGTYLALGRIYSDNKAWSRYETLPEYVDYEKALSYFKISADRMMKNNRYIAYLFYHDDITGFAPEEGDKTAKDTALRYMQMAASMNDATANYEIGKWYLKGEITPPENMTRAQAAVHYFEACNANANHGSAPGVRQSLEALSDIYLNGKESRYLKGVEGAEGIAVSLPDAERILTVMCGEKYYGDEYRALLDSIK